MWVFLILLMFAAPGMASSQELSTFVEGDPDAAPTGSQLVEIAVAEGHTVTSHEVPLEREPDQVQGDEMEPLLPYTNSSQSFLRSSECIDCMLGHGVLALAAGITVFILWLVQR